MSQLFHEDRKIKGANGLSVQAILKNILILCILSVPVSVGALNPSAEIAAILGVLTSIALLPALYRQAPVSTYYPSQVIKLIVAIYFCIGLGSLLLVEDSVVAVRSIGTTSHFLFFIVIYSALQRTHIPIMWFWLAIVIGAMINGLYSLYFAQRGSVNPILYGNISVTLAFASLLSWRYFSRFRWGAALPILGFSLGLLASFYSLARGSWLAMPALLMIVMVYLLLTLQNRRRVLSLLVGLGLVAVLAAVVSEDKISHRLDLAATEVQGYFAGESYQTSIGYRLEMYKGAIKAIQENPIWGAGLGEEMQMLDVLSDRGEIRPVNMFEHPHNQILQEGLAKGILGIVSYLLLMGYLLYVFAKGMCGSHNREVNTVGVILIVGFFIFGLTNITFILGVLNTFFVCMLALLLTVRAEEGKEA